MNFKTGQLRLSRSKSRKKRMRREANEALGTCGILSHSNTHYGSQEKRLFEEIMTENFLNLVKYVNLQKKLNKLPWDKPKEIHTKTSYDEAIKAKAK